MSVLLCCCLTTCQTMVPSSVLSKKGKIQTEEIVEQKTQIERMRESKFQCRNRRNKNIASANATGPSLTIAQDSKMPQYC